GDRIRYEPVPEHRPTAADLQAYAGRYRSEEAEATWRFGPDGDALVLHRRFGETTRLEPLYRDVFEGGGVRYRFVRGSDGRVEAVSAILPRVWDMRFARLP